MQAIVFQERAHMPPTERSPSLRSGCSVGL